MFYHKSPTKFHQDPARFTSLNGTFVRAEDGTEHHTKVIWDMMPSKCGVYTPTFQRNMLLPSSGMHTTDLNFSIAFYYVFSSF